MSIPGPDDPARHSGHEDQQRPRPGLHLAPFRGLRYVRERVGSLAAVTSPPYDVVVRPEGQRHLETADPHNVVRLILPDSATPVERHRKAARALADWQESGVLAADPDPALYIYEQIDGAHLQRGIIGALRLPDSGDGVVLPHEDVMPGPVADRAALMDATRANLEPLLLTYRDGRTTGQVIDRTVTGSRPLLATTTEDGVHHRLWGLTDAGDIAEVQSDLATRQALIADGHHRWATYQRLRAVHPPGTPWDYGLVLLVDTGRYPLRVRAIHRVLPNLPLGLAVRSAQTDFRVRAVSGPLERALEALADASAEGNAYLLAGNGFHLLDHPRPDRLAAALPRERPALWRGLDATVLHSLLLDLVWRIPDSPDHILYIHDAESAVQLAQRSGGTAVLLHPVREQVVLTLARAGEMMPRKSTSFGPKPASGLVIRSLDLE